MRKIYTLLLFVQLFTMSAYGAFPPLSTKLDDGTVVNPASISITVPVGKAIKNGAGVAFDLNTEGKNYIANNQAIVDTTGWATYADASSATPVDGTGGSPNVSFNRNTSTPLTGAADFWLNKGSSNVRGHGVSYDFTIDLAEYGTPRPQTISFNYRTTGTFNYNAGTSSSPSDVVVYIYDKDGGVLIQPDVFTLDGSGRYVGQFQPNAGNNDYRLILHNATTNASSWNIYFDNVRVGPRPVSRGTNVTAWETCTPLVGGWVTSLTATGLCRRVGDSMQMQFLITLAATPTAATVTVSVPSGYTVDTAKLVSAAVAQTVGEAVATDNTASRRYPLVAVPTTGGAVRFSHAETTGSTSSSVDNDSPFGFLSGDTIGGQVTLPISGWGTSANMSFAEEIRTVAANANRNGSNQTGVNPNNSLVKIAFNSVDNSELIYGGDTHSAFDTTNNRFVAPITGWYQFNSAVFVNSTNVLNNAYRLAAYVNGTLRTYGPTVTPAVTTAFVASVTGQFKLNAGEYVEIWLEGSGNNSASTLTVNGGKTLTYFNIARLPNPAAPISTEAVNARGVNSTTSISGSLATIDWSNESFDSHNALSTGVFTCPVTGKYQINVALALSGTFALNTLSVLELQRNSSAVASRSHYSGGAVTNEDLSLSDVYFCNAGDTFRVQASSGATSPAVVNSTVRNYFSISKVGSQ